jgi:hypothetical protein
MDLFKDKETGEIKTKKSWIRSLAQEAAGCAGDAYDLNGADIFQAMLDDGALIKVED